MEALGLKLVLQRRMGTDFDILLPSWLGDRLGSLVVLQFDGSVVTIGPAIEQE